jgi:hypothetical protein
MVAAEGDRRVYLDPSYVTEAVQLGYASTDYGNEGVTTVRSVTSVGSATSAGGLYVGATRGRYDNTLHLVAEDREDARAQLVAALGRDRADRGLDVARARAEAEASPTVRPLEPDPPAPLVIDPAHWRTEAELDQRERQIEVRFSLDMSAMHPVPVMPDEVRQRANEADQAAAAAARRDAAANRAEADRLAATEVELVARASADYMAAREDARIIEAGPGRFGRKAAKVDEAWDHRSEVARRWSDPQLPGSGWSDEAVRGRAAGAAERVVDAGIRPHRMEAARADKVAEEHDRAVVRRDHSRESAISVNKSNARNREVLLAKVERDRARIAEGRELRAQVVATIIPEEVSALDQTRDALLVAQERQRRMEEQLEASTANERYRSIERDGPGLGL